MLRSLLATLALILVTGGLIGVLVFWVQILIIAFRTSLLGLPELAACSIWDHHLHRSTLGSLQNASPAPAGCLGDLAVGSGIVIYQVWAEPPARLAQPTLTATDYTLSLLEPSGARCVRSTAAP